MNNLYKNYIKRLFDIFFSILGILVLLVILIPISLLIFLEDKGPVFYNSKRLGKNGKIFNMYKFRTMKVNAPDIRNEDGSTFNSDDDPRLTKIGSFLRKTSIDELPQLLNVLKGDMSLIGPRPDLPEHSKIYTKEESRKLEVLPGITGYNQAYYRNSIEWKDRLKNDVYYVNNLSFFIDIKILFKTITSILGQKGIFVDKGKYEIFDLKWDTEYFETPSCKIVLKSEISLNDIKDINSKTKKYKFFTIINENNNYANNTIIGKYTEAFLTDINVQYEKKVSNIDVKKNNITIKNNYKSDEQLLSIAKQNFVYSRFYNDKKLNQEKSKLLYYNWLKNSFDKEDKYICAYAEDKKIIGFLLFRIEEKMAIIELIAVDNTIAHKGIGTTIINNVEKYCYDKGVKTIKVGTQLENIIAQNFYIKNGFKVKSYSSIFHYWR